MNTLVRAVGAMLVAVCPAMAGCSPRESASYRIGIVLDEDGIRGATLAADRINASGGINGRRLELTSVTGASSTKARVALQSAERLAADPTILAIVGHTNSAASLAASQVYNTRRITQIAPTSSTPLYSRAGPYSFRLVGSDLDQGVFLANHVLSRSPRLRTAVLYTNDDYGRPLRTVLVDRLRAAGFSPVYDSPYIEDGASNDYTEMTIALARTRPELLVWIGRADEFVRIQSTLQRTLPGLVVLASDGFDGPLVSRDTAGTLAGVSYVRFVDPGSTNTDLLRVREWFAQSGLGGTSDQAILSYDAVMLLGEALRHAGSGREAIRDWLWQVGKARPPFAGISGPIAFRVGGDREPVYFIQTISRRQ